MVSTLSPCPIYSTKGCPFDLVLVIVRCSTCGREVRDILERPPVVRLLCHKGDPRITTQTFHSRRLQVRVQSR
jgi:hypothetical protein